MSAQGDAAAQEHAKRARLRKVYILQRIPRVKAEIAALATRRKSLMNDSERQTSKEIKEELIYSNQHLLALRTELEALEKERNAVLQEFRETRLQQKEKHTAGTADSG